MEVNSEGSEEGREIWQETQGGMKSCSTTVNNSHKIRIILSVKREDACYASDAVQFPIQLTKQQSPKTRFHLSCSGLTAVSLRREDYWHSAHELQSAEPGHDT